MSNVRGAGRVEDILQTYDRERRVLPPPVRMWEWGWTKSAETWNGRIASAPPSLVFKHIRKASCWPCLYWPSACAPLARIIAGKAWLMLLLWLGHQPPLRGQRSRSMLELAEAPPSPQGRLY